ncbi:MAG: hypothetical protein QMD10_12830, partial [Desulfitobacteriaceae bacterium]|nr:hypothetical protein [Desulfitobacteriaceae bacterium]
MFVSCLNCHWFREVDFSLNLEDPWVACKRLPYRSLKGCAARPAPKPQEVKKFEDISQHPRCVTRAVARMVNNGRLVVRYRTVYDPETGRSWSLDSLEFQAMMEEAEWCDTFT